MGNLKNGRRKGRRKRYWGKAEDSEDRYKVVVGQKDKEQQDSTA